MRTFLLALVCTLPLHALCQYVPEVVLLAEYEVNQFITKCPGKNLTGEDSIACTLMVSDRNKLRFEKSESALYYHTARRKDLLVVIFRDANQDAVSFATVGTTSISISFGDYRGDIQSSSNTYSVQPNGAGMYFPLPLEDVTGFSPSASINAVTIQYNNNGVAESKTFYFRYLSSFSNYGNIVKNQPFGIWFPLGQFGTDFKKTDDGILFSTLPIGAAVGTKINFTHKFYVGVSYSLNYSISKSTNATSGESFAFTTIAHGPIIDFGDYLHVGYNWLTNLSKDDSLDRASLIVVGIGIKVTDVLKNTKLSK